MADSGKKTRKFQAINVINTPTASSKISNQDLLQWINNTLKTNTIFQVQDLGTGEYYCLLLNQLFAPREPVFLKKVRFNSKSDTDLINNWRAFQSGLKAVGIDKEIPIERLIAKKPSDNVEFAQWFYKFYQANKQEKTDEEYDPVQERNKRGIHLGTGQKITPRSSKLTKPRTLLHRNGNARKSSHESSDSPPVAESPPVPVPAPAINAASQYEVINLREQVSDLQATLRCLEKERDFYFGKLRDIEIMCQDTAYGESLPITDVISILYSAEEGFAPPDPSCISPASTPSST